MQMELAYYDNDGLLRPLGVVDVPAPAIPYPAFESTMGDTLIREVDDQVDAAELWRRAVRLQLVLDRVAGLA